MISPQALNEQKEQQEADYIALNSQVNSQATGTQPPQHLSNNPHLSNSRKDRQAEQVGSIFQSLTVEIPLVCYHYYL
jgi:hypothetical protein